MSIPIRHTNCLHRMMAMLTMTIVTLGLYGQTRVEYFFDTDPGHGQATESSATPDASGNVNFTASTNALAAGLHVFGVRVMNGGHWTPTVTQLFVVPRSGSDATIHRVEYFWDTDPGYENATPITITPGEEVAINNFKVSTEGLSKGLHLFGIRAMSDKYWSPTVIQMVYIPTSGGLAMINRVEYFWDTDPGYGKATPIAITPGMEVNITDVSISTEGLSEGSHLLGIRAFGDGHWSPTLFYVKAVGSCAMNADDLAVLRSFYNNFDGIHWNGERWNTFSEVLDQGDWSGVTFNTDSRVTGIDLTNRGLSGRLSADNAIGSLPLLKTLNLSRNALTGDPGAFLANNQQLETINLEYNQLDELSVCLPINASVNLQHQHRTYNKTDVYQGLTGVTGPVITVGKGMANLSLPAMWGYSHSNQTLASQHPKLDVIYGSTTYGYLNWDNSTGTYSFTGNGTKPLEADDGASVMLEVNYSTPINNRSVYPATLSFILGDANMNGVIDVNDVQMTLNYILGVDNAKTISLWAANTYTTNETSRVINIQDLVCSVNMVLANTNPGSARRKLARRTAAAETRNCYYAEGRNVMLDAKDETGAFDLEIDGVEPEQVSLLLDRNDWQMMTRRTATGGTRLIVLSLTGARLPVGTTSLLHLEADGALSAVTATSPMAEELNAAIGGSSTTGIDEQSKKTDIEVTAADGQLTITSAEACGATVVSVYGAHGGLLLKQQLAALPAGETTLSLPTTATLLLVKVQNAEIGTKNYKLQNAK